MDFLRDESSGSSTGQYHQSISALPPGPRVGTATSPVPASAVVPPSAYLGEAAVIVTTDIERSTAIAEQLGHDWTTVVATHHAIVQWHFNAEGGFEASNQGDGFLYLFGSVDAATRAAIRVQRNLAASEMTADRLQIRIGIHIGRVGYLNRLGLIGVDIHRCARITAAAGGGQILLSAGAAEELRSHDRSATLVDHGRFALKGLNQPERLFELALGNRRVTGGLRARPLEPALPEPAGDLIGRRSLMRQLQRDVIDNPNAGVVTLCGTGGVGKTRLAVEFLRTLNQCPWLFVDLSNVESPDQLVPELALALGLGAGPDLQLADVAEELRSRSPVVVLDNLEQIIDAAPTVAELAQLAPEAKLVVTSRRPLRVAGESVIEVEPLPATPPDPKRAHPMGNQRRAMGAAELSPAAHLFVHLAAFETPSAAELADVERICVAVDGLPLAIELAAGRLTAFSVRGLADSLMASVDVLVGGRRDAPRRHQALEATVRWSYDLLDSTEREVFAWLSQLPGGASASTISQLTGLTAGAAMNALHALVEHHLVGVRRHSGRNSRFRILRVIREVASEQLLLPPQRRRIRAATTRHFSRVAGEASRKLQGPEQLAGYETLRTELDNVAATFGWVGDDGIEVDDVLPTASRMLLFWWQGNLSTGIEWLRHLTGHDGVNRSVSYADGLSSLAMLCRYGGASGEAVALAMQVIDICQMDQGRNHTLATALGITASSHAAYGNRDLALADAQLAVDLSQELPDSLRAFHLNTCANVFLAENHIDQAEQLYTSSMALFDSAGATWLQGTPLSRLAECALRTGDVVRAEELALDALSKWGASPGANGTLRVRTTLARILWCQGRFDDAETVARDSLELAIELANHGDIPWATVVLAAVEVSRSNHKNAAMILGFSEQTARRFAQPVGGCLRYELLSAVEEARSVLGSNFEGSFAQGERMTMADLVGAVAW